MKSVNKFLMYVLWGISLDTAIPMYGATFATATLESKKPISLLPEVMPYNGKIVIKSKVAEPIYLAFFDDNFEKIAQIVGAQGSLIALEENQQVVLSLTKKGSRPVVVVSRNKSSLESALAITSANKRNDFIWNLVKSPTSDVTYFTPSESEIFLVYMNNLGLIPGLLRGAGIVNAKRKDTSFTQPGKVNALRLSYKDENASFVPFVLTLKPDDYAQAIKANVVQASTLATIEGVVDDVVTFEKAQKA